MILLDGPQPVQRVGLTVWTNDSNGLRSSDRLGLTVKKKGISLKRFYHMTKRIFLGDLPAVYTIKAVIMFKISRNKS